MTQHMAEGKKWELRKKPKKREEKRAPPVITLDFWLLRSLGERQGEEKGERLELKKKKSCAELNFISRWFFKQ